MRFCLVSKKLIFFGIIAFSMLTDDCLGRVHLIGHTVKKMSFVVWPALVRTYSQERARRICLHVQQEVIDAHIKPLIELLWTRSLVELGRRQACPHGTEDHAENIQLYQEGVKYWQALREEYPELRVDMSNYYRLAVELWEQNGCLSVDHTERFLSFSVDHLVNILELRIAICEEGNQVLDAGKADLKNGISY